MSAIKQIQSEFFNGYIAAALFSSNRDDGEPLDNYYSVAEFDKESLNKMEDHATKFLTDNFDLILDAYNLDMDEAGMLLWYTENGHGTGYWDEVKDNDVADKLTDLAGNYETHIYVGDDNKLYI